MRRLAARSAALGPWCLPLLLGVACTALAFAAAGDARWHRLLDYRRAAIGTGDGWRLVTGHLMHWSNRHAALDIGALALVAWIFETTLGPRRQVVVCVATVVVVDAALWTLHPSLDRYVGLSGLLHGWFAAGAVVWAAGGDPAERRWGAALLAGLAGKLALESNGAAFWHVASDFPVVTDAHRWGAAAGLACGVVFAALSRRTGGDAAAASRAR